MPTQRRIRAGARHVGQSLGAAARPRFAHALAGTGIGLELEAFIAVRSSGM
jgi:hypothetical protein